jgi:hypothetical protein
MPTPSESLPPREAIKRNLLLLIIAIVILDSFAIAMFYLFHFNRDIGPRQNTFIGIWMLLSAVVVAVQLRKIRRARTAIMRGTDGGQRPTAGTKP